MHLHVALWPMVLSPSYLLKLLVIVIICYISDNIAIVR